MAHTSNADTKSTIFSRLRPEKWDHLKPISAYSRFITCDQTQGGSLRQSCNQFINLKIEVINNCPKKRKLDSSPDDCYETPAKRACSPQALSPDLGCFMDYCSPATNQDSVSPPGTSTPALLNRPQAIRSGMKENLSSEPHLNAPLFDHDVNDILCLNPQNKQDSAHNVAHRTELGKGDGQVKEEREEPKKEMHLDVNDVEEDKGYFSMSYLKDHKTGGDSPQLPPLTSSPLFRRGEDERQTQSAPEPGCHKGAGQDFSFTVLDSGPVVKGQLLKPVDSLLEPLGGDVEETWNIGPPLFESSVCNNATVKLSADGEQSRRVSEEVRGDVTEPISERQAAAGGEESTLAAPPLPLLGPPCVSRTERPVIGDTGPALERAKQIYLHLVTRHVNENQGGNKDVMTELLNLMTHVAGETHDRQWQHPSDLTRRNYSRRFGSTAPTMSLREWQARNSTTYKRFANLPKIFQRSPYP